MFLNKPTESEMQVKKRTPGQVHSMACGEQPVGIRNLDTFVYQPLLCSSPKYFSQENKSLKS